MLAVIEEESKKLPKALGFLKVVDRQILSDIAIPRNLRKCLSY